jgi:N-acylneuraminate cytidylyltransferase/CMP-N,N'-diacetyllegionaminic acid synthase
MIDGKKILGIIPARGGSKGIPNKNIRPVYGKPLIAYSIEAGLKSKYIDDIVVSTDSAAIKEVSEKYGAEVPFIRPVELSGDKAGTIDAVLHALDFLEKASRSYDYTVLLQPTSPLRTCEDIDSAIEAFLKSGRDSLVSLCEVEENPYLMQTIENGRMKRLLEFDGSLRRQDLPKVYIFNGAIYINKVKMLKCEKRFVNNDTLPFIMEDEKSIDIDTIADLKLAEFLIEEREC